MLYSPVAAKIYLLKICLCYSVPLFYSPVTPKVYLFAEIHIKVTASWTVLIGSIHNHWKIENYLKLDRLIILIAFTAGVTFYFGKAPCQCPPRRKTKLLDWWRALNRVVGRWFGKGFLFLWLFQLWFSHWKVYAEILSSQTVYTREESLKHSVPLFHGTMSQTRCQVETWLNVAACYFVKEGREQAWRAG